MVFAHIAAVFLIMENENIKKCLSAHLKNLATDHTPQNGHHLEFKVQAS